MIIANPIYDEAFKALLFEERTAKFLIGTLLNEKVVSVVPAAQEYVENDKDSGKLLLFRMDFHVIIHTEDGQLRRVLIEMQKARVMSDILPRFRSYLGHHYSSDTHALPITTIYVLDFVLPGINTACCRIGREYYDLIGQCEIKERNSFIEQLTHDCYVVQAPLISLRFRTPLERLLNIFEQAHFDETYDNKRAYKDFPCDRDSLEPELKFMVDKLSYVAATPEYRKILEREMYYENYVKNTFGSKDKEIEEKTLKIVEKDQQIANQSNLIAEQAKTLAEQDRALAELKAEIEKLKGLAKPD